MLPRPKDPNIVWGSHHYTNQKGDFGLFDLKKNGQVEKTKFDLDETQVWGVDHETSMLDSTHNGLNDDII